MKPEIKDEEVRVKIFVGKRSGKTSKLIRLAAEEWLYIVCFSVREAERVQAEAKRMGFDIPAPVTFHDFVSHRFYPQGVNGFVIDQVDMCLRAINPVASILALSSDGEVVA